MTYLNDASRPFLLSFIGFILEKTRIYKYLPIDYKIFIPSYCGFETVIWGRRIDDIVV